MQMARPKLPIAQRKGMVMTVRMRLDLNEGLAAVAVLRGTTRSGLVSQYAAEQIRLEQERDRPRFDATVKGIRFQRETRRRKESAQSQFEHLSDLPDCLKASTEHRPLARPWCLESRPHDRLIGLYMTVGRGSFRLLAEAYLSSHEDSEPLVASH
jgi:hypothetical protein